MDNRCILGIESTCDETAAAVVVDGREIITHVIASQAAVHEQFGGVYPELASRHHLDKVSPIITEALRSAPPIDCVAVAQGPGLVGSLLVGINAAKGVAMGLGVPLIGINHVEAHLYAAIMGKQDTVQYPALGVVLSGGHTALLLIKKIGEYELISSTADDAVGEAFDKVAAMLDLPYPGGPHVEKLAKEGDPHAHPFRAGRVKTNPFAFSFSGLKTSVLYACQKPHSKADIAASFQRAAFSDIKKKMTLALEQFPCRSILLGGGVTNNKALRDLLNFDLPTFLPPPPLTLDNAAMIAGLAYEKSPAMSPSNLTPKPRLKAFWS